MTVFHWVLLTLTTFRITRLITDDDITQPVRDRIPTGPFRDLLTCVWCSSVWIAAILFTYDHYRPIPTVILATIAAMTVAGYLGVYDGSD